MMEAIRTHLARRKAGLADTYRTLVRKLAFPNALDAAPTPGEVARVAGELGIEAEQIDRDIEAEKISRRRRMKILVSSMTPRPLSLHPSECFPMDGWINNPDSISIADIEFDPYPDQPAAEFKAALEVIRLKKEGAIVPLADKLEILKSEGFEKRDPRQSWKKDSLENWSRKQLWRIRWAILLADHHGRFNADLAKRGSAVRVAFIKWALGSALDEPLLKARSEVGNFDEVFGSHATG